jgi:hypothetical protein
VLVLGESATLKTNKVERPIELKIVVFLEVFVAIRYLIYTITFLSISATTPDYSWVIYLILMLVSLLIAYGLWRFARWVWITAIALSVLGVVSTISILVISGASMESIFQYFPSVALDLFTIALLLLRRVKSLFWGPRTGRDSPSVAASPQNP